MRRNGQAHPTGQDKYTFTPPIPPNQQQQQQQQQQQINQAPLEKQELMDMIIQQMNMVKQIHQTNQTNQTNQQPFGATTGNLTTGFGDLQQLLLQQQQYGNLGIPGQPTQTNSSLFGTPQQPQTNNSFGGFSSFNFGSNQVPSTQPAGFSLGSNQVQSHDPFGIIPTEPTSTGFNFGTTTTPPPTSQSSSTQPTGFNFGDIIQSQTNAFSMANTGFDFSTFPSQSNQPPTSQSSSNGFNFGSTTQFNQVPSTQPTGFDFGYGSNQVPQSNDPFGNLSEPATGFNFGTPQPQTNNSFGGFSSFNFGSNQVPSTQPAGFSLGSNQVQSHDPFGIIPTEPTSTGFNFGTVTTPPPPTSLPPASQSSSSTGFNFGSTNQSNQESFLEFLQNVSTEEIESTPNSIRRQSISSQTEVDSKDIKSSIPPQPKKNFLNSLDGMDILSIVLSIALVFFAIFVFYY